MTGPMECYIDSALGIYVPKQFAIQTLRHCISGVCQNDLDILKEGPDHEEYWESWETVLHSAILQEPGSSVKWTLYHDGDLFLVHENAEWSDEEETYVFPSDAGDDL